MITMRSGYKRVVSLEMFIIDSVIHEDPREGQQQTDQIGGSGTYAMVGARMFLPASRLGMIVNFTPETLPSWMRDRLESFGQEMWYFKERKDGRGTTRSVQRYHENRRLPDCQRSETLFDDLLFNPSDLLSTPFANPLPTCLHMTSVLSRTRTILAEVSDLAKVQPDWHPTIVWEPYYAQCKGHKLNEIGALISNVDVFSPNHIEALALCSSAMSTNGDLIPAIEQACMKLASFGPKRAVIIRSGALGACYTLASSPQAVHWVPAYWTEVTSHKVVDPTGAGNGFLGGLCAGLDEGISVKDAIIWGSVSASFIVEQEGLPYLNGTETEMWNDSTVKERIAEMNARTSQ